jgi:membrane-associated protease RseP (regulator of RpoE activity)
MNRILLTGTALLTLIGTAIPAQAAPRHATRYRPAPVQQEWLGSGARVEGVDRNSAAERAGLRPGDVIVGINGTRINNNSDVDPFVAASRGRPLTLDVNRGGAHVRLRATPLHTNVPTPWGGVQQRRMLGYSYTTFPFGGSSDDSYVPPPPPPPDPPPPPPPPPPLPPITN